MVRPAFFVYTSTPQDLLCLKARKAMSRRLNGILLIFLMSAMALSPLAMGADSDGDGVEDSVDDCRFAAGTSTVDRDGCPDRDGDGTSDFNDGWTDEQSELSKMSSQLPRILITTASITHQMVNS